MSALGVVCGQKIQHRGRCSLSSKLLHHVHKSTPPILESTVALRVVVLTHSVCCPPCCCSCAGAHTDADVAARGALAPSDFEADGQGWQEEETARQERLGTAGTWPVFMQCSAATA